MYSTTVHTHYNTNSARMIACPPEYMGVGYKLREQKSTCVCSPSHLLSLIKHVTYSVLVVPIRSYIVFAVVKHMVYHGV